MKARLKVLPDKLRGGAWPSPVRAVRCPVKSGNDRDPRLLLPAALQKEAGHTRGTAADKVEEGVGHGRSVCPESSGPHASCNDRYNGFQLREEKVIPKACLSWDRGLKLALVNMESLVIARHQRAVNTSPLLAHTARRSIRVGFG
jgi:hypothetical protein